MSRDTTPRRRAVRKDAQLNRERVLRVAAEVIAERGENVPMAEIADAAGVGVGTLYRGYPNRAALLEALQRRAYDLLLQSLERILASRENGADAVRHYLLDCVSFDEQLVLPLRGAPALTDADAIAVRTRIFELVSAMITRGRDDGTLRGDVTVEDVVACGTMIGLPLPDDARWAGVAERHVEAFVRGIRA